MLKLYFKTIFKKHANPLFWEIIEKMKTDVYRQILFSVINNQISDIVKFNFSFSGPKFVYLRPLLPLILLLKF